MWMKITICFSLVVFFIAGCSNAEPESKIDPEEQAKQIATEFKEKQYMIEYDKGNLALSPIEASKVIEEKVKPLLTKEAFAQNAYINNFTEPVDMSNLTKSNLSLKSIEFDFKEQTEDTFIFDYAVEVLFEKYDDESLTQTESITGEMKVTDTDEDGWQVSSSTQTHFNPEHIKSMQEKFGVPVGLH